MLQALLLTALAWLVWAAIAHALINSPRGEAGSGLLYHGARLYAFLVHRARATGREHVPASRSPGPLIVVVNHTAGIDPLLVQVFCPFEVRWMMAADMQAPILAPLWRFGRVIPVDRDRAETGSLREALRHLRRGGVIGIFPEGGIERPPRRIMPFLPGVGAIVKRTGAPVLPVVIRGTPAATTAWGSLWRPSRSSVEFLPVVRYGDADALAPADIAADLRRRFVDATGWPRNDEPDAAAIRG